MDRLYLCLLLVLSLLLTACASGATVGIGGGGGSYGGGGGIGISFPVGGDVSDNQPPADDQGQTSETWDGSEDAALERDPDSAGQAGQSGQAGQAGQARQAGGNYIGSNLNRPYPKHNCAQPLKPDPGDSSGIYMIYKQKLDKYRLCMDAYANNAKNDMMDIEAKANSALREYRLFVTRP